MKNTEFNLETLGTILSSDSLRTLIEMVGDLGLEIDSEDR